MKLLIAALVLSVSTVASAAKISKFPLNDVTLAFNAQTEKVEATGTLIGGQAVTNSLFTVDVNSELKGKFEVEKGIVRLALKNSGAFVIGKVEANGQVTLFAPYKAYQISERYDAVEKSFGQVDVDYITLDVEL